MLRGSAVGSGVFSRAKVGVRPPRKSGERPKEVLKVRAARPSRPYTPALAVPPRDARAQQDFPGPPGQTAGREGPERLPSGLARRVSRVGRPRGRWALVLRVRPGRGLPGPRDPSLARDRSCRDDGDHDLRDLDRVLEPCLLYTSDA